MVEKNKYMPILSVCDESGENTYVNELRKKYGSNHYAIDPYVEVFKIRDNVWAMLAPCTHAVGDNWIYLIEGPERALFIDNGYGIGNLRGLGELLTGKDCITAPTHFHGDHAYGSAQFDEIYCHKYCADNMKSQMNMEAWKKFNCERGPRNYYLEKDILPSFVCEPISCEDHTIINLGEDYDIELIHVGGHASGESCYLDKKGRILYTGDAVFYSLDDMPGLGTGFASLAMLGERIRTISHPECMDIKFFGERIAELAKRVDEFDSCMPGHGPIDGPASLVPDTAEATRIAIDTPEKYDEEVTAWFGTQYNVRRGYARVRYGKDILENR